MGNKKTALKNKKEKIPVIKFFILSLFVITGIGLMGYPFVSNWMYMNRADSLISSYTDTVGNKSKEKLEEEIALAKYYNSALASGHVELRDPFTEESQVYTEDTYYGLLDLDGTGLMGYISIPCIDVSLPIYHGTDTATLERGVGHLAGSSLPVGGESTHTILTGHTGLSSAKMFTDLTKVEEGDIFILSVFGQKIAYKVDQIIVVEPSDISQLQIVSGEDYCSLVTCTPYGVNSHRLIVRGIRTEYEEEYEESGTFTVKTDHSQWMSEYIKALKISVTILVISLIIIYIFRIRTAGRKHNDK